MDICMRCREELPASNMRYICRNCGSRYCDYCSTMTDSQVANGEKPTSSCSKTICPSCGRDAGERIE